MLTDTNHKPNQKKKSSGPLNEIDKKKWMKRIQVLSYFLNKKDKKRKGKKKINTKIYY